MSVEYRGFWTRVVATLVDSILTTLVALGLSFILLYTPVSFLWSAVISWVTILLLDAAYEILFTVWFGGTLGKLALRMRVTNEKGQKISYGQSAIRYFSKILSSIILFFGYFMIGWDEKKQGLHDKIAKTYVLNNSSSGVSVRAKNIIGTITVLIVVVYIAYSTAAFGIGIGETFNAALHPLDAVNTTQSLHQRCDEKPSLSRDFCYAAYDHDPAWSNANIVDRISLCQAMDSASVSMSCIATLASETNNRSLCTVVKSYYRERQCSKVYDMYRSMREFGKSAVASGQQFRGELSVSSTELAVLIDDSCAPMQSNTYSVSDTTCFLFKNVTGFEKGADGLQWYVIDVTTWHDGILLWKTRDAGKGYGHRYLANNTLTEDGVTGSLSKYAPGAYTAEYTIYDNVSKKVFRTNVTFMVQQDPVKNQVVPLDYAYSYVGRYDPESNSCVQTTKSLSQDDVACFLIANISGFRRNQDGFNWFDMDVRDFDANGTLISYTPHIFKEDGYVILRNNVLSDRFVISNLSGVTPSNYSKEVTVYDVIGGKRLILSFNYTVVPAKPWHPITFTRVDRGFFVDYNQDCNLTKEETIPSTFKGRICLQPMNIQAFAQEYYGLNLFEMSFTLTNSSGAIFEQDKQAFGEKGHVRLCGNVLNSEYDHCPKYYSIIDINEYPPDMYNVNLTVYDLIGHRQGSLSVPLKIV